MDPTDVRRGEAARRTVKALPAEVGDAAGAHGAPDVEMRHAGWACDAEVGAPASKSADAHAAAAEVRGCTSPTSEVHAAPAKPSAAEMPASTTTTEMAATTAAAVTTTLGEGRSAACIGH